MKLNQLAVKNVRSKVRTSPLLHLGAEDLKTISGGVGRIYLDTVKMVYRPCGAYTD